MKTNRLIDGSSGNPTACPSRVRPPTPGHSWLARGLVVGLAGLLAVVTAYGVRRIRGGRAQAAQQAACTDGPATAAPPVRPAVAPRRDSGPREGLPPGEREARTSEMGVQLVRVTGRLVEHQGGQPVSGAEVSGRGPDGQPGSVTSDAGGRFVLEAVRVSRELVRLRIAASNGLLRDYVATRAARDAYTIDVGTIRLVRGDWNQRFAGAPRGLIGLEHELRDGKVIVTAVRPDTPAQRAGLRAGERILTVDGVNVDGMGHAGRTYYLQGKAGTRVALVVADQQGQQRTVTLARQAHPGAEYSMPFFAF